jgi:ESF2/ABP1 family protein
VRAFSIYSGVLTMISPAHEAAVHEAQLRVELSQSRKEQREYLKNVELARVLDKRAAKKRLKGEDMPGLKRTPTAATDESRSKRQKRRERSPEREQQLNTVLTNVF